MPEYAATTFPSYNAPAKPITKGSSLNLAEARGSLSKSLQAHGLNGQQAAHVVNSAQSTWTDFPEYGVTVYVKD